MPWTKKDYPDAMKNLPAEVREKSIEIANALLDERDMNEGLAIATAISRAKDWAANRGKDFETRSDTSRKTDVKQHGEDRYVIPQEDDKWAIKKEKNERVSKVFDDKQEAVKEARKAAKEANASLTVQKRDAKVQQRVSYNPNKQFKKQK
jgi:uncharacterized protein YdaT